MNKSLIYLNITLFVLLAFTQPTAAQSSYYLFESGHTRPLALSPDGNQLFAVNTPDNRIEIYTIETNGLVHTASVPVGLEPVSIAARNNNEVWVVNHLSDSVSIVDVAANPPRVINTLLVGDEPRDIVFAGDTTSRAFITTAHRGQHRTHTSISAITGAGDPQLTTEGIGRADVWVFDTSSTGNALAVGGTPVEILSFFADTPRALAVSPNGQTVYVAAFKSGNQTTTINETFVCDGFQVSGGSNCTPAAPGGIAGPNDNEAGANAPETGLIVKYDGSAWRDTLGRDWSSLVNFNLPDNDVFSINADTLSNASIQSYSGVGTILFNLVVNPATGKVYISNTESPNDIRFEGAGDHGGSTVQGHLSETRITVIDPTIPSVTPKHLNQHIDYSKLHTQNDLLIDADIAAMRPHSLAGPMQIVVNASGTTAYLAAFGSAKIGVFATADLEDANFATNFDPSVASSNYISTAGGPSGLVLDEARNRIYVMQRFDHSIAEIELSSGITVNTLALDDPEPASIKQGRPFLYDAQISSGNGESSCASCHIFGDLDDLAWNLGDPDDVVKINNQPSLLGPTQPFHPMKGPMTTQTLRGLSTHGGMHWRGDRVDGFFGTDSCTEATGAACNEDLSFRNFIVAFEGLLGKDGTISAPQMQQFTDFSLQMRLPPNPVANLDGTLTTAQSNAANTYFNTITDTFFTCNGCHKLDPAAGFFGTGGEQTFDGEPQFFKVPQLRNLYQKVGMFGNSASASSTGDQIRGFGFAHDGSLDTAEQFLSVAVFSLTQQQETEMEQFILAYPTDLAAIVGQQVTLNNSNSGVANPRIDLLRARAQATFSSLILGGTVTECDLVVKGTVANTPRGWLMQADGSYNDDLGNNISDSALRNLAVTDGPLTFTCAVPGSGIRMAINRDEDSVLDGADNCVSVANDLQANFDGDTMGDACDLDDDNDSLPDAQESVLGTDPFDTDTDNDGFDDAIEVELLSDPLDANSIPAINVPMIPAIAKSFFILLLLIIAMHFHTRSKKLLTHSK
jgi:YVTN family beta-propeller protein